MAENKKCSKDSILFILCLSAYYIVLKEKLSKNYDLDGSSCVILFKEVFREEVI